MATLARILDEMADQIRAALGDDVQQVVGRMVINPSTPCVDMWPADPSSDPALAGMGDVLGDGELISVRARVSTADNLEQQDVLLGLMDDEDDRSLALAIHDDETLNGTVTSLNFVSRTGYTLFPDPSGSGAHLGFTYTVEVVKARS